MCVAHGDEVYSKTSLWVGGEFNPESVSGVIAVQLLRAVQRGHDRRLDLAGSAWTRAPGHYQAVTIKQQFAATLTSLPCWAQPSCVSRRLREMRLGG